MEYPVVKIRSSDTESLDDVFLSYGEAGNVVASVNRPLHPDPFLEMFHLKIKALAGIS